MTVVDRSRPLGYNAERHRRMAMEKLELARRDLERIKNEARLLATSNVSREAIVERALSIIIDAQNAQIAVVEAENELHKMRTADANGGS